MNRFAHVVIEGPADEPVALALLHHCGLKPLHVIVAYGKANLDRDLQRYNQAARHTRWFVLRDLDNDAECAATLVHQRLPDRAIRMCFRIAVRETEAWLLADRESIADYLGISRSLIPEDPDSEEDPKRTLVQLARRSSRRAIREEMVPADESHTARVGPAYVARIGEFVASHWKPDRASRRSDSLARAIRALKRLR